MKKLIKSLIPDILIDIYHLYNNKKFARLDDCKTWEEAENISTGYDTIEIIQKVQESALKVKNGKATYERDSFIFDEIQYSWPLLAGLMFAVAIHRGELKLLDFGGSLGTTYFQNKKFLDKLQLVSWNIVEQKHFVNHVQVCSRTYLKHAWQTLHGDIMVTSLAIAGTLAGKMRDTRLDESVTMSSPWRTHAW